MSQANIARALLLRTTEGLLLQLSTGRELSFDHWTSTLHLRPSRDYVACGIKTGKEVARAWAENPPTTLWPDDDDPRGDVSVFLGSAMFSVPQAEAVKLQAWLASPAVTTEAH